MADSPYRKKQSGCVPDRRNRYKNASVYLSTPRTHLNHRQNSRGFKPCYSKTKQINQKSQQITPTFTLAVCMD